MKRISVFFIAITIAITAFAPVLAQAAGVGSANVSGIVTHVSTNNIKITDATTHKALSFLIVPKFKQVFSEDGKTTYQMNAIKPGQYVKIYYDQKALGARHADRILLLRKNNTIKSKQ
ncbi:hypothetical protein EPN42_06235 [bacterium]|nr:MAG: hypothetical protein EPN42_06235 [bacterium]